MYKNTIAVVINQNRLLNSNLYVRSRPAKKRQEQFICSVSELSHRPTAMTKSAMRERHVRQRTERLMEEGPCRGHLSSAMVQRSRSALNYLLHRHTRAMQYSSGTTGAFPFPMYCTVQGQDSVRGVDTQRTQKPKMKKRGWETSKKTATHTTITT